MLLFLHLLGRPVVAVRVHLVVRVGIQCVAGSQGASGGVRLPAGDERLA